MQSTARLDKVGQGSNFENNENSDKCKTLQSKGKHTKTHSLAFIKLQLAAQEKNTKSKHILERSENMHNCANHVLTKESQSFDNISKRLNFLE